MSPTIRLEDTLGEASSFVTAIRMAASDIEPAIHGTAIDVLAEQIALRLERARCIIAKMPSEGAPVNNGEN
ncbi:MAG: hypothetical protein KL863_07560 [Rhizobium sp.]|nr:hypothetical protein [Rhizobium sp.]